MLILHLRFLPSKCKGLYSKSHHIHSLNGLSLYIWTVFVDGLHRAGYGGVMILFDLKSWFKYPDWQTARKDLLQWNKLKVKVILMLKHQLQWRPSSEYTCEF